MTTDFSGQFGPYSLEQKLGEGGQGAVYRAYYTGQNRQVALKVLHEHLAADEDYRARFHREARITIQLEHPHIVPIHSFGEIDSRLYLDMRFVRAEPETRCPPTRRMACPLSRCGS